MRSRSKVTQVQGHSRVAPRLKALSEWSRKIRSRSRSKVTKGQGQGQSRVAAHLKAL